MRGEAAMCDVPGTGTQSAGRNERWRRRVWRCADLPDEGLGAGGSFKFPPRTAVVPSFGADPAKGCDFHHILLV